ncbi:helix-turn-helix domain-containing protein [Amycolatopsis nigrescens]|uniref:helix-turn-helix domain-containing protein n=1 Tax=Amycolatopsis nigrescens TaxID=381445 RepID=UPI000361CD44|nr:helix-turn-helix domain-containing protein [Amycolatopsis nigrescens]
MERQKEPAAAQPTVGRGVLEGAFLVLEELARLGEAGPAQVGAGAGLHKATAHRLLDQLVGLGAVQRRAGRYRMGPSMFRLGQAWQPAPLLRTAARNPLRQLAAATRTATVGIGIPEQGRTRSIGLLRGELGDDIPVRAGLLLPHGCNGDRLWAIDDPDAAIPDRYSRREWKRLITDAHEQGVALGWDDDIFPSVFGSVFGAAAPVRASSGKIIAAVSAAVLDRRRLTALAPAVRRAADMISANLNRLPAAALAGFSSPEDR